jgi:hypothetical protein
LKNNININRKWSQRIYSTLSLKLNNIKKKNIWFIFSFN